MKQLLLYSLFFLSLAASAQEADQHLPKANKEFEEKKYNEAINEADKFFKTAELIQAKEFYTQALGLLNKPWPKEQIEKINKLMKKKKPKKY